LSEHARWSVDELLVRYDLEPQLADVFVEGAFDKDVLTEVFASQSREGIFYQIDVVNIPQELLDSYGLTSGNKQRVVALSRELERLGENARVRCLVDRDLDHWFGDVEDAGRLRWTRFCSIESHFISDQIVSDLVIKTANAKVANATVFILSLFEILKVLYALRLADRELSLSQKWVAIKKYLGREGDSLRIDTERYVTATLSANAILPQKNAFMDAVRKWQGRLDCDVRLASRGHDYSELLALAISQFDGHRAFKDQSAVERLFVLLAKSVPSLSDELN